MQKLPNIDKMLEMILPISLVENYIKNKSKFSTYSGHTTALKPAKTMIGLSIHAIFPHGWNLMQVMQFMQVLCKIVRTDTQYMPPKEYIVMLDQYLSFI